MKLNPDYVRDILLYIEKNVDYNTETIPPKHNELWFGKIYKDEYFKERGIDLLFVKNNVEEYNQHSKAFVKDLSIIDVLMHNGKEGTKELLKQCELIKNNSELIKDEEVI